MDSTILFGDVMKDKKDFYDRFIKQFLEEKQNNIINKIKKQKTCITFDELYFDNNWDVLCYCLQNKYDDIVMKSLLWQLKNFSIEEEEKIAYTELTNIFGLCKQYITDDYVYKNDTQDIIAKYLQNNILRIAQFTVINSVVTKQLLKGVADEVVNRTIECLKSMPPIFCDEYESLYQEYKKDILDGDAIYDEDLFYDTLDKIIADYLEDILADNIYSEQIKYALLMQNIDCDYVSVDQKFHLVYDDYPIVKFLRECLYNRVCKEPLEGL